MDKGGFAAGVVMRRAWSQGGGGSGLGSLRLCTDGFFGGAGEADGGGDYGQFVVSLSQEAFALADFALAGMRTQGMQGFVDMGGGASQVQGLTAGQG